MSSQNKGRFPGRTTATYKRHFHNKIPGHRSHVKQRYERMVRVTKQNPCPVCEKPDYCLVAPDGSAAICPRISEGSLKRLGDAGWLHILIPSKNHHRRNQITMHTSTESLPDFSELARACTAHITANQLNELACQLGVSARSLQRLGVGTLDGHEFTFPMSNAEGKTIGIRIRTDQGHKYCKEGSKTGLFIPRGLTDKAPLLVTEGPTDCAAALDLGFDSIGRPNCNSRVKMTCSLCVRRQSIVIVADNDPKPDGSCPGVDGATALAESLSLYCPCVKVIIPPIKDLRQWLQAGLTHDDLQAVIDGTAPIRRGIR